MAYIADSPLLLGVRWLRMELSLSVAMLYECKSMRVTGNEMCVEKRKMVWEKDVGKSNGGDKDKSEPRFNYEATGVLMYQSTFRETTCIR